MNKAQKSASRLYLLWVLEEHILSALAGRTGYLNALTTMHGIINDHPDEMTATEDDKKHLVVDNGEPPPPGADMGRLTGED